MGETQVESEVGKQNLDGAKVILEMTLVSSVFPENADLMEQSDFGVPGSILEIRSSHTFCLGEIMSQLLDGDRRSNLQKEAFQLDHLAISIHGIS
jgi:hypothetical protein